MGNKAEGMNIAHSVKSRLNNKKTKRFRDKLISQLVMKMLNLTLNINQMKTPEVQLKKKEKFGGFSKKKREIFK